MVIDLAKVEKAWKEKHHKSAKLYEKARKVNINRMMELGRDVWKPENGVFPPFTAKAKGSRFWDVDGNCYLDMYSHMAPFLGHSHPAIVRAIQEQAALGPLAHGSDFFELQDEYCRLITKMLPCAEIVTFSNSGTEGAVQACRIARAHTKREKIIKLDSPGFHGHSCDSLATNSVGPPPQPTKVSRGIPTATFADMVVVPGGDIEAMEKAVKQYDPAAVIITPRYGSNCGMSVAQPNTAEYLKAVREITEENGVAFILDQVVSAFRDALGGAEEFFGVNCDLSFLGKMVSGGIGGAGAVVGKQEWMEAALNEVNYKIRNPDEFATTGGTFSTCQLSVAAGYAAAKVLYDARGALNRHANKLTERLIKGLNDVFERHRFNAYANGCASICGICFTDKIPVETPAEFSQRQNKADLRKFYLWLMTHADVFAPTAGFVMMAVMTYEEIETIISAAEDYVKLERAL